MVELKNVTGTALQNIIAHSETTERSLSSMRDKLRYALPGRKHADERLPIEDIAFPGVTRVSESDHG